MKTGRIFGIFAAFAAFISAPAMAQDEKAVAISGDVKVVKTITGDDGETRTELADTSLVVPGDRLIYRTNYRNQSAEPVENFVFTNKLSKAVSLDSESAAELTVSVDDGANWGALSDLSVSAQDGSSRPAQASDVTHVRRTVATIQPGETGQITFYAIVR